MVRERVLDGLGRRVIAGHYPQQIALPIAQR